MPRLRGPVREPFGQRGAASGCALGEVAAQRPARLSFLLTGIGLAQHDGLAILLGQGAFLATVAYFIAIGWGIVAGVSWLT